MGTFFRRSLTLVTALSLAFSLGQAPTASAVDPYNFSAQQTLVNQDRAANGALAPLAWNNCLANIAQQNADRIAQQGYLSHTNGPTLDLGCLSGATYAGENIAYDSSGINDALANTMFMNSPPHRANILGGFTLVATAWTVASNGYGYIAEEFLNAPVPAADPFTAMVTVDAFGGVHADGSSLVQGLSTEWPGWRIGQSAALLPDGTGGYLLDGFGGLHPFGSAGPVVTSGYWANWNIARDVAILPGSTGTTAKGYVLDGLRLLEKLGHRETTRDSQRRDRWLRPRRPRWAASVQHRHQWDASLHYQQCLLGELGYRARLHPHTRQHRNRAFRSDARRFRRGPSLLGWVAIGGRDAGDHRLLGKLGHRAGRDAQPN